MLEEVLCVIGYTLRLVHFVAFVAVRMTLLLFVCLFVCLHAPNENQIDYLSYCLLVAFALLFVFDSLFLLSDSKKSINNSSETNIDD